MKGRSSLTCCSLNKQREGRGRRRISLFSVWVWVWVCVWVFFPFNLFERIFCWLLVFSFSPFALNVFCRQPKDKVLSLSLSHFLFFALLSLRIIWSKRRNGFLTVRKPTLSFPTLSRSLFLLFLITASSIMTMWKIVQLKKRKVMIGW